MAHWLVKTEPDKYPWSELVRDGETYWDGVRNYQARNYMREMGVGDLVLVYHSQKGREVVGIARISGGHYRDPTSADGDDRWVVVDLVPVMPMVRSVTLAEIKADSRMAEMKLVRQSRLSVMPVTPAEFAAVLELGETETPAGAD